LNFGLEFAIRNG